MGFGGGYGYGDYYGGGYGYGDPYANYGGWGGYGGYGGGWGGFDQYGAKMGARGAPRGAAAGQRGVEEGEVQGMSLTKCFVGYLDAWETSAKVKQLFQSLNKNLENCCLFVSSWFCVIS